MDVVIVVAVSENGVIGRDNDLPWHLPADLKHFKETTRGLPVLMGRGTWESIGSKPLPGRVNIVVTSRDLDVPDGVHVVRGVPEGIDLARSLPRPGEIELARWACCVVGGQGVYEAALPMTDRVERTLVHAEVEGDRRFPALDPATWARTAARVYPADDRHAFSMTFETWTRRRHA